MDPEALSSAALFAAGRRTLPPAPRSDSGASTRTGPRTQGLPDRCHFFLKAPGTGTGTYMTPPLSFCIREYAEAAAGATLQQRCPHPHLAFT